MKKADKHFNEALFMIFILIVSSFVFLGYGDGWLGVSGFAAIKKGQTSGGSSGDTYYIMDLDDGDFTYPKSFKSDVAAEKYFKKEYPDDYAPGSISTPNKQQLDAIRRNPDDVRLSNGNVILEIVGKKVTTIKVIYKDGRSKTRIEPSSGSGSGSDPGSGTSGSTDDFEKIEVSEKLTITSDLIRAEGLDPKTASADDLHKMAEKYLGDENFKQSSTDPDNFILPNGDVYIEGKQVAKLTESQIKDFGKDGSFDINGVKKFNEEKNEFDYGHYTLKVTSKGIQVYVKGDLFSTTTSFKVGEGDDAKVVKIIERHKVATDLIYYNNQKIIIEKVSLKDAAKLLKEGYIPEIRGTEKQWFIFSKLKKDKEGNELKKEEVTLYSSGDKRKTTTEYKDENEQTTEVYEFADGSKKETVFELGETKVTEKAQITYTTTEDESRTVPGKDYIAISDATGNNEAKTNLLLKAGIEAGISTFTFTKGEEGEADILGDKTGIHVALTESEKNGNDYITMMGDKVTQIQSTDDKGDIYEKIEYEGAVTLDGTDVKLGAGSVEIVFKPGKDGKDVLSGRTEISDDGLSKNVAEYKDTTIEITTYEFVDSTEDEEMYVDWARLHSYTIDKEPMSDGIAEGKYKVTISGETFYFDAGGLFGLSDGSLYKRDGDELVELTDEELEELGLEDIDTIKDALKKSIDQHLKTVGDRRTTSQRKTVNLFKTAEYIATEFKGLGYFASWFMSDEALEAWKNEADELFAKLYLGTDYWVSDICATAVDRSGSDEGVAWVDSKEGLASVGAHIEATRSSRITVPPGVDESETFEDEYLYKITFHVQNGNWDEDPDALDEMVFNIRLIGERSVRLFEEKKVLKKGEGIGYTKENAILQYSKFHYSQICIELLDVPSSWDTDNNRVCNKIVEVTNADAYEDGDTDGGTGGSGGDDGILQI